MRLCGLRPSERSVSAPSRVLLQQLLQVFCGHLTVSQNLSQETPANSLPGVDGHDRASAVRMFEETVAAFGAKYLEPCLLQGLDQAPTSDAMKITHARTATR